MAAIQPALPADYPQPIATRNQLDDFEEWVKTVWPAFERAADSGQPFTTSQIQERYKLPDPPNPQSQWGHLPGRLVKAGLIEEYAQTGKSKRRGVNSSRVAQWIGIPPELRAERAA